MGKKRNIPPKTRLDEILLDMAFWVLLAQLLGTAIYFTGKFSNPQAHKELIAQFCAALAVGLWFLAQAVCGKIRLRLSAYYVPLLLLIVWSAVRTATSVTPLSTRKWILVAQVVAALPVWVDLMESPRRRLLLSWGVFLIGCIMAGGALIESFGYYPHPLISQYHRQSIGSFVGHNNPMAAFLLMASIHAIGLLVRFRHQRWCAVFWVYLAINLYLFILSGSRGAWLSFPFAMAVLFLSFHGLRRVQMDPLLARRIALSVIVCVCAGVVAVGAYTALKGDSEVPSVVDRIRDLGNTFSGTYPRVWTMSTLMLADRYVSGVGFAAWPQQYPYYQGRWFSEHPDTQLGLPGIWQHTQRSHSDYLQLAAELGLIGLLLLIWLLLIHIREAWKFITAKTRSIAAAVGLTAMTGVLAHALVYFPFHAADSACPFLVNWSLFIAARGRRDKIIEFSGPLVRWIAIVAALFFLFVATRPVGKNVTADVLTGQTSYELPRGTKTFYGWNMKAGALCWTNWAEKYKEDGDPNTAILA
ncbi:MAG: O-antigen ligase family protein, partial [bacterium]